METALPMLLFFAFLFGFGLLIVVCGYQSREQERAETPSLEDLALQGKPRFFGSADRSAIANPVAVVVDESAIRRLERFLQEEMALAEVFVGEPSVEALHSTGAAEEPSATLFERLEAYLRREHQAAASFVLDPSVESLYGALPTLAPAG